MKTYVVRWECMSSDFYGHPSGGILGVFQAKKDAVIALENMSDTRRIRCWHGGGGPKWRLYKVRDDVGTESPVTIDDLIEWGYVSSNEVDAEAYDDLEMFIDEYEMGVLRLEA